MNTDITGLDVKLINDAKTNSITRDDLEKLIIASGSDDNHKLFVNLVNNGFFNHNFNKDQQRDIDWILTRVSKCNAKKNSKLLFKHIDASEVIDSCIYKTNGCKKRTKTLIDSLVACSRYTESQIFNWIFVSSNNNAFEYYIKTYKINVGNHKQVIKDFLAKVKESLDPSYKSLEELVKLTVMNNIKEFKYMQKYMATKHIDADDYEKLEILTKSSPEFKYNSKKCTLEQLINML